jgi:hypothetical protein
LENAAPAVDLAVSYCPDMDGRQLAVAAGNAAPADERTTRGNGRFCQLVSRATRFNPAMLRSSQPCSSGRDRFTRAGAPTARPSRTPIAAHRKRACCSKRHEESGFHKLDQAARFAMFNMIYRKYST